MPSVFGHGTGMTTDCENGTATIRTPEDVLRMVPLLLGFQPADCLVAMVVRQGAVCLTARCPIDDLERPDGVRWLADKLEYADGQSGKTQVFVIGYGGRSRAAAVVRAVGDACGDVIDAYVVDGGRWWYADDDDAPGCVVPPPDRTPSGLVMGPAVAGSREELCAAVAAPSGEREDELLAALVDACDLIPDDDEVATGQLVLARMSAWSGGERLSDAEFLSAGLAMSSSGARDEVWRWLTRQRASIYLPFWKEVLTRTPHGLRAVALAVTGMVAWIAGEGALMNICREEARQEDPGYPLVQMLDEIARWWVPPDCWDDVRSGLCGVAVG